MDEEHVTARGAAVEYALVHLVVQEAQKELIAPQVIDHMAVQADGDPRGRPSIVIAGFIEPVRHTVTTALRRAIKAHQVRAPEVKVTLLPYTSRLSQKSNARILVLRLQRLAQGLPIVFHCRGERAAEWAAAFGRHLHTSGIILDVRGAWPEEMLFAHGYENRDAADEATRQSYDDAHTRLKGALAGAGAVLTVSPGLVNWLTTNGVASDDITYVPCCVRRTTYSQRSRGAMRRELGVADKLVLAYVGTIAPYQHVEDGLLSFFSLAQRCDAGVHFLCLTSHVSQMRKHLREAQIDDDRVTVRCVPQGDVAAYLAAGDAGLLLRAPSRLNTFSQPTKLAEYLAAGLPVVVSRGTGTVAELIERERAGIAIDWFTADADAMRATVQAVCTDLRANGAEMREASLQLCDRHFTWRRYTGQVRNAYAKALPMSLKSGARSQ